VRKIFVLVVLGSWALVVGCGGSGGGGNQTPVGTPPSGSNVVSISIDGGPLGNYANGVFASATICAPGSTTNCVTVDHLLVDTGSFGLRVLQSALGSVSLPALNASDNSPAFDCVSFADGSFLWGPVEGADVTLGSETAANLPIHVISSSTANIPTSCSNGGTNENSQQTLLANGILGVGLEPTDCFLFGGSACDPSGGLANPPSPAYYTCPGSSCSPAFVPVANQVTNPVVLFQTDNNGVIVELPSVSGSAPSVTGSLVFGIGTQSNNQLASGATVFTLVCDDFTTMFQNQTFSITDPNNCTGPGSFIDSGSNALYFPDVNNFLPTCPNNTPAGDLSPFYCPSSLTSLSATNQDPNDPSVTETTNFSVDNAENLFTNASTSSDAAFSTLGGMQPSGAGFDWGLPFFFGRSVYSTVDGQGVPSSAPNAPWWAY